MKNFLKYLLLISIISFTYSCSDDEEKEKPLRETTNYYPLTDGSFWVYLRAQVNPDGSVGTKKYERSEVNGSEVISGKTVTKINTYEGDSLNDIGTEVIKSNFFYSEDGKTYVSISFIEELLTVEELGITIPLNSEVKFITLIDEYASNWNLVEIPFTDLFMNIEGEEIIFTGKATLKAKSLGVKQYTNIDLSLNGNAVAYEYMFDISGKVYFIIAEQKIDAGTISIKSSIERLYMKDVGQVKRDDSEIKFSSTGLITPIIDSLDALPYNLFELKSYTVIQ